MTVGAGCCERLAAWSDSSRQARCPSTASRIMCSEIPVIRATAGGICSPSGSAIRRRMRVRDCVRRTRAQPISRRCPRGAAAVAWQSTTSTSSCESGSERLPSTIATTRSDYATAASMRRTCLSEQLLQSSLLQRLVGADRDAIAPATNLLHGEPMTGGGLAHLNLELGSRRDRVGPASCSSAPRRQELRPRRSIRPSPQLSAERRTDR